MSALRPPGRVAPPAVGAALLLLCLGPARAGGPRVVDGLGQPLKWSTATPIVYNPDPGPLGTLSNAEARDLVASAFGEWAAVGVVSFTEGAALPMDVNGHGTPATNPDHFLHYWRLEGDGRTPVIFDQDGSVIDGLFGKGARFDILGLAALDTPPGHCLGGANPGGACDSVVDCPAGNTCVPASAIIGAGLVINGLFRDGVGLPASPPDLASPQALEAVMVHEIGHLLNLDHSVVNHELAYDGNPANDTYLPTMYPLLVDDESVLATLNPDDIAALRALYDPGVATAGIAGVVRTAAGVPFQGADVVVRKVDDPLMSAYSGISGALYFPCNLGSVCNPCETACDPGGPVAQGAYDVRFIAPGSYRVCVEQMDTGFSLANGVSVGPLATPPLLPGPEECYDLAESGTVADDPDDAAVVVAGLLSGIDVWLDALPGSDPLEPNNTLGGASPLADLAGGHDTAPAHLGAGDLDFYAVPVVAGKRLRVDVEAEELGSGLDAVLGLYDASNTLLMVVDDAIDPDSGAFTLDPALDVTVNFTGTAKVVVSSYPDLDLNGIGGTTTGGYWIRVRFEDDRDGDGVMDSLDNCPAVANAFQFDFDNDGLGDACDDDDDGDGLADSVETNTGTFVNPTNTGTNPLDADSDGDGVGDGVEVSEGRNPVDAASGQSLFSEQRVITTVSGAWWACAADVDGDGDLDALSAAYGAGTIAWHENDGGAQAGWTQRVISAEPSATSVFAADVDGDGDMDVLSSSAGNGSIAWHDNNGASPPAWTRRDIGLAVSPQSVAAADVDGDGDMDVLSASEADSKVAWYENNGASPPVWTERVISLSAVDAFFVSAGDIDGDGDIDVVSANYGNARLAWYENDGSSPPVWTARVVAIAPIERFALADVDGDGDLDVVSATDESINWHENSGSSPPIWTAHVIFGAVTVGADAADVDGDGDIDVLAAEIDSDTIAWHENLGGSPPAWARRVIVSTADGAAAVLSADIDEDGDMDALSVSIYDGRIAWYENRSIQSSVAFPAQSVISYGADAQVVGAADVDRDGDQDVLSAYGSTFAWYENDGGSPPAWTERSISTAALYAARILAADVDGDGDVDAVSAFNDRVAWYENDGASPPAWIERIIVSGIVPYALFAADVDRDGDMDVLAAAGTGAGVRWYENNGSSPPVWTERSIIAYNTVVAIVATDMDRDGDVDVLFDSVLPGVLAWHENDGASPPAWTQHIIATGAAHGSASAADMDRDGDVDVILGATNPDMVAWYENDGASPPGWTERTIGLSAGCCVKVFPADLDGDGDVDVLSSSDGDNTGKVAWYENDGGSPPAWTKRVISTAITSPLSLFAADLDGDGDLDALSASLDDKIAWYENRGGQYAFNTQAVAPSTVADGATAALLRIDLAHRGRAGDPPIALSKLALQFEESPGDSLSAAEAHALMDSVYVVLDDGSGVFEEWADYWVGTVATFTDMIVDFPSLADPRLHVAPGMAKSFFVVAEMTLDASSQSPHQFRVTHLTGSSAARDAASGLTLRGESASNVSSGIVVITAPDQSGPVVTAVYPAAGSVDVALSTSVVLVLSEPVNPATATSMAVSLSVGGLKVPGTVSISEDGGLVVFDPDGTLSLDTDYVIGVTAGLRDLAGNAAVPFSTSFDTANAVGAGQFEAQDIGGASEGEASGAVLDGADIDDHFGFAVAAVGDVNQDTRADLVVGAPNANTVDGNGNAVVDAGEVRLVFGGTALQSNAAAPIQLIWAGSAAQEFSGEAVSRAGDLDDDGIADFAIGAPRSDQGATDAGLVYVVFGDLLLDEQASGPPRQLAALVASGGGVVLVGQAPGDLAGTSVAYAGDLNGDGHDDLLVGAPGASPGDRIGAGKVYLLHGPLAPGVINLGTVGTTTPGLVFQGETAGDSAGSAVSWWEDALGPDDLLIAAPSATVLDEFGSSLVGAGYVYAIHGGMANLDAKAVGGVIELSRVANGQGDQVDGTVFLGSVANARIGRSVTGAADVDGDGVDDVIIGGYEEVWLIPGDGPKTASGSSTVAPKARPTGGTLARHVGGSNVVEDFGATAFRPGADGALGALTVGPAGDVNRDGIDDVIIGAAAADPGGRTDAGKAYIVYGRPSGFGEEVLLSEVGETVAGIAVAGTEGAAGAEPGDNLGAAVGGGFDLTGDGVDDALIGAPFADTVYHDAGQAYVISPVSPDEVVQLFVEQSGGVTTLEWTVPHRALAYNVYRGLVSALRSAGMVRTSDMTQLACGTVTSTDLDSLPDTTDAGLPPIRNAYYYLVTAENIAGEGPLGPPGVVPPRVLDAHCP